MDLSKRKIISALKKKGFKSTNKDHIYFYFYYKGKSTKIDTKLSHGTKYKSIDKSLQKRMQKQLHFDKLEDFISFCDCKISENDYINILKKKRILSPQK